MDQRHRLWVRARKNRAAPFAIFFQKTESDFAALGRRRAFPLGRANICYLGDSEVSALREFFAVWPKSDIRAAFWEGQRTVRRGRSPGIPAWSATQLVLNSHLCISTDEQCKRFMARLDESMKRWKF